MKYVMLSDIFSFSIVDMLHFFLSLQTETELRPAPLSREEAAALYCVQIDKVVRIRRVSNGFVVHA